MFRRRLRILPIEGWALVSFGLAAIYCFAIGKNTAGVVFMVCVGAIAARAEAIREDI